MFSQSVEYGLQAVIHLASVAPAPRTTEQIAAATRVPPAYLAKVLRRLVQAGVVRSQRGLRGGISLAHRPEEMTLLPVVNALTSMRRVISSLEKGRPAFRPGLLHPRIDNALTLVEDAFGRTTLAEVVAGTARAPMLAPSALSILPAPIG
jgi:Rrf2 family nitric oxide-sensitive transcriptional repressor